MARPKKHEENLVPYHARLLPETKSLLNALVSVSWVAGQRELIEEMLELFRDKYPDTYAKAEQVVSLQDGGGKE